MSLDANSVQTERFRKQIDLKLSKKKQFWKQIVKAKTRMQAVTLEAVPDEPQLLGRPPPGREPRSYAKATRRRSFVRASDGVSQ